MSVIPCERDDRLRAEIARFAEALKTETHRLGDHGLSETGFYRSPLFRGAIEQVRGEFSATMRQKREFARHVLNHLEDRGYTREGWASRATSPVRHVREWAEPGLWLSISTRA
jgi:hypothetical protein